MFGSLARAPFWKSMAAKPLLVRTGALLKPRTQLLRLEKLVRRRLRAWRVASDAVSAGYLISAFEAAAKYDIYWSNECFYRWLKSGVAPRTTLRSIVAMDRRFVVRIVNDIEPSAKLAFLRSLARDGRFPGAGVAAARALATSGRFTEALELAMKTRDGTRRIMGVPGLHIVDNQVTALQRKVAGKPVHRALHRYLGDDDEHLSERICPFPFERIDIHENGNASVCCAHWTPFFSIGNIMDKGVTASDVFNSPRAFAIRESVLDGSFRYCDHDKCPWLSGNLLPRKDNVGGANTRQAVRTGRLAFERPSYVFLAFDASCNLSCPSCRLRVITEKGSIQVEKEKLIESSIMPLLRSANRLNINAAGELFVSRPLRHLLSTLNRGTFPNLVLELITNGTLLTPGEWAKFPGIHDMVDSIRVSTDGATKATFERLRRGARWEPFIQNMRFLASLCERDVINLLQFSFTYQLDNFREMPAFVDMCQSLCPSARVVFEKLENWGTFTIADYSSKAVHLMSHPLHEEFLSIIRLPKLRPSHPSLVADYAGLL
jgi:hypothetical protein